MSRTSRPKPASVEPATGRGPTRPGNRVARTVSAASPTPTGSRPNTTFRVHRRARRYLVTAYHDLPRRNLLLPLH